MMELMTHSLTEGRNVFLKSSIRLTLLWIHFAKNISGTASFQNSVRNYSELVVIILM